MEIEEKKVEEIQGKPQLFIGIVPCLNELFIRSAWSLIKPEVERLAEASLGEYTTYQVYQAIYFGSAHLYIGFVDRSGKIKEENAQAFIMDRLSREIKEDFSGYLIARMDPAGVHLWQGYIVPEFQHGNVLELAINFIKNKARETGSKHLSFSTFRPGWGKIAQRLGFVETFTTYRADLGK